MDSSGLCREKGVQPHWGALLVVKKLAEWGKNQIA